MTYGEMMKKALACETKEQADAFLTVLTAEMQQGNPTWTIERCLSVVQSNLGYMAGYYDAETAKKVLDLFQAAHPIFGTNYFSEAVA